MLTLRLFSELINLLCPPALAHTGQVPVTVSASVWWEWRTEWLLFFLLLFAGGLYIRFLKESQRSGDFVLSRRHPLSFFAALALIYLAIASPIDRIGEEYLFSVHMIQHNLFMYPVPWLILMGIPGWMAEYWFERLGTSGQRFYRFFAHPILACLLFNLVFTLWHLPFLYDWALRDRMVHNLEHASMLLTAIFLWLPLWSPLRKERPLFPVQLLYLLAVAIAQLPVFAYVTFSKTVLYPTYALAPRLTIMSPLADQQAGGVIMKLVTMLVLFGAFLGVFMAWYKMERQRDDAEEQARFAQQSPAIIQS